MQDGTWRFEIHPSSGVPIYRQIMEQVRALAAGGTLRPGDLLPSVRQLALDLGINMMTVSKAYSRLESEGVVEKERGTGMRVRVQATNHSVPERQRELRDAAELFVKRSRQFGLSDEQILAVVKAAFKERRS